MRLSSTKFLAVSSALIIASGMGIWSGSASKSNGAGLSRVQKMATASGEPLRYFFVGLPTSPMVRRYAEMNEGRFKRGGKSTFAIKLGHFFGFGAVVYAQSCGGCNESTAPPGDCDGCGTRWFTQYGDWTGNGFYDAGNCGDCSTTENSYTCPGPGC